jgi:hypothetical protein
MENHRHCLQRALFQGFSQHVLTIHSLHRKLRLLQSNHHKSAWKFEMKLSHSIAHAAAVGMLMFAIAAPSSSFAHDEHGPDQHQKFSVEERTQWAKNQLDKEASRLEIKASQQSAWETYAAANLELINTFGGRKPLPPDINAAAAMCQHAEHAEAFAQKLAKLADATEKLQSVLSEDQRKVLDRTVRMHSQFHAMHFQHGGEDRARWQQHRGIAPPANASKPSPKAAAPAKPKE